MATANLPADPSESNHFDMLELDPLPSAAPAPAPALPEWAIAAIAAIRALVASLTLATACAAHGQLEALVAPVRARPNGPGKDAVRTELRAAEGAIRAMLATTPAPVATPVAAPEPVTHSGEWSKLGSGEWGAYIETGRDVRPGDRVFVRRKRGGRAQPRTVAAIDRRWDRGSCRVSLVPEVTDDTGPITTEGAFVVPAMTHEVAPEAPEVAPEAPTSDFGAITAESTANASTTSAGSLAGGQLGYVGFTSAAGYITALANGVKQATADQYRATLRDRFGMSAVDVAALPTTIIPEVSLPVGAGVTYTPRGKRFEDMTPAERRALRKVGAETRAEVAKLLDESALIAGAVAAGSMLQVSWVGGGKTTVSKIREAFSAAGLPYEAPTGPSTERHAGRAVDSLKSRGMDTTRLPSGDLPNGIKARWLVGRKLTGKAISAGDAYGHAALIVSLTDGGALTFDGASDLEHACRAHFDNATANEVLVSADLTDWYGRTLRESHYAVKRGHLWYVPAGEADAARALSECLEALWGDHERIPVTTGADLMRSLARGLADEVRAVAADFDKACETARERAADKARKDTRARIEADNKRAARWNGPQIAESAITAACDRDAAIATERAAPSPHVAARLLLTLTETAARVSGYRTVLGEDAVKSVAAEITALRDKLEPLCSDGDQRAAMLELT